MTYVAGITYPTRPPLDANDVLAWYFTGADGAVEPNQGSGGACDLQEIGNPQRQSPGPFGYCAETFSNSILCSARPAPVTLPATFSITVAFRTLGGSYSSLFTKKYTNDNVWADPFSSVALQCRGTSAGAGYFSAYIAVGGVRKFIGWERAGGRQFLLVAGLPHVMTLTYDNATGTASILGDGNLVESVVIGSPRDVGGDAEWCIGGRHRADATEPLTGSMYDARVANIVRPLSYNLAFYRSLRPEIP